jgi:hypothetical protein
VESTGYVLKNDGVEDQAVDRAAHLGCTAVARRLVLGVLAVASLAAPGCADDTVDITQAVQTANEQLSANDARLTCPDQVDRSSRPFDCTVAGTKTGRTARIKAKLGGPERDTLQPENEAAYQQALEEVTRQ